MKPFGRITEREISKEGKAFILNIMKLDLRDRQRQTGGGRTPA
jgi:hypothetical protein